MKSQKLNKDDIRKLTIIGVLTSLATVLSFIKIPIIGTASITLVMPVIVIGAALYGPYVGAWLTIIPNILAFSEAGIFLTYAPVECVATLILKGVFAGLAAGFAYKLLSARHPIGAVAVSAVIAPTVNSLTFLLGCYLFIWDELVALAGESGVGVGMLILGLVVINYIVELILNIILCPSILRIIRVIQKKNTNNSGTHS